MSLTTQPTAIPFAGGTIAVRELGQGPPVLLLHNAGNDSENWAPIVPRLAASRRVILVDLAGFGASSPPEDEPTLDLYADQVRAVLDHLAIAQADLIGHCVGGAACWLATLRWPERVRSLALLSPATLATMRAGAYGPLYRLAGSSRTGDRAATLMAKLTLAAGPLRRISVHAQFGRGCDDPDFVAHCEALYRRPSTLATLRRLILHFDSFGQLDVDEARVSVPTMLLWGTHNRIIPYSASAPLRARLEPQSEHVLEGAGHLIMRERAEEVGAALEQWLSPPHEARS